MTTYQKIPGPFKRDPATNKLTTEWSNPELGYLKDTEWVFTEKVDGTNVRVIWDGYRVTYGGRTDNAQLPIPLFTWLVETFGGPEKEQLFEQKFGSSPAVLYGEGYGPKIQSGGKYRTDISVVFYDVRVGDWSLSRSGAEDVTDYWWLSRSGVEDVTDYFKVDVVPVLLRCSLVEAIRALPMLHHSFWGEFQPEGLVGMTSVGLRNRAGERVMVKLKARDLVPK